jgi:DNA-directed RNA polymerase specialized sigma subunit
MKKLENDAVKNFDDLIEEWHNSNSEMEIYEYIGMTKEEYFKWVEDGN